MSGKPTWRRAFDSVERALGEPLEGVVASQRFVDVMAVGMRARRLAVGTVRGAVAGVAGAVLHAVNIPTSQDVQRLNRNLAVLATEVRAISAAQQQALAPPPRVRPGRKAPEQEAGHG